MDFGTEHPSIGSAKKRLLLGLLLFLATLLTFLPAAKNDFVTYDDPEYVTENVHVREGLTWDSVKWAFAAHGANWHPVTWLSHIVDGQLFGQRPWGHHLGNVLLHAINTLLVFLLFVRMTRLEWPSFFVALLFGLHPLRVESVAWVSERKDVLSGFFFLLTLLAYVRFVSARGIRGRKPGLYYVLALVLFGLGLMSKSMLVTTPCVMMLLDYWPLERFNRASVFRVVIEKIPFFLLTLAFSAVAYVAQAHGSAMNTSLALSGRVANALVCWCLYLGKIFWPAKLSPLYPYSPHLPAAAVIASAVCLTAISTLAFVFRRRQPALIVGWLWYLGMTVPIIGLVKIGEQSMADRYTYLPSLGVMLMVVWGARAIIQKSRPAALGLSVAGAAAALACIVLTQFQIACWRNTEAMFQRAADTTQNNTLADVGLGICLAERGKLDDAIKLYRASLEVSPSYFESHYNLALALLQQGKYEDAIKHFRAAIDARPGEPRGHVSYGVALAKAGQRDDAIAQFHAAADLSPSDPLPHDNLAKLLASDESRLDEAINEFQIAVRLQPANAARQRGLSALLMRKGRHTEAVGHLEEAVKLEPTNADIHNDLGSALAMSGKLDDAIAQYQTALKLNPGHDGARRNLARALAMKPSSEKSPAPPTQ